MTRRIPRPAFFSFCGRAVSAGLLAFCLAALPWVGGCGTGDSGKPEAEFVFANRGEVTQLDPNKMSWAQDIRIGQALYEGVYTLDPETLDPILGTGQDVQHSDDYKTWTIRLRPDAKWSNGDDVTADDFVFAWRRNMREPGDYSYLVTEYVRGADDYAKAYQKDPKSADFSAVGIEKVDDHTLKVELANPVPYFPDLLAFVSYWPLNEKSMEPFKETGKDGGELYDEAFTQAGKLVTNGAYKLTRWDLKQGQTLEMNEFYWDKNHVKSRTVRSLDLPDANLAFQRYERGMIDWITDIPGQQAYDMRQAGRKDLHVFPAYGTYFWTLNTADKLKDGSANPLSDVRVRQALVGAIDKQQIVDTIAKMDQMVTDVYVPKNADYFPGYKHPTGIAYDVDASKKLLAEAGYPGGRGFPRLKLLFNTGTGDHEAIAQNLARQWKEKLGVEFDLDPVEMAQFKDRYSPKLVKSADGAAHLEAGDFALARGSWYGDYMDVTTYTDKYLPLALNNDAVWDSPRYAALCQQAKTEADPQKRLDLLAQAEQILVTACPILPLYHYTNTFIEKPGVSGIPENPRNMVAMKNVETPRSTGPGAAPKVAAAK